jgi:hypothetical protein
MGAVQKLGTSLMSAIALALMGIVPAVIAVFMFAAMFGTHTVTDKHGRTVSVSGGGDGLMLILACFLGFVGFFLLGAAVYTVYWGITKSKVEEDPDADSWKDMPYPKG